MCFYHEGKIQEVVTISRELELKNPASSISSCIVQLDRSVDDGDIDTTSMLTANTDEEILKEVLATHVSSQDMESIIRLCKEGRMQYALMFYDEMIKKGLVQTLILLVFSLGHLTQMISYKKQTG